MLDTVHQFKWAGDANTPSRAYAGDAGFDLVCAESATVEASTTANIPVNLSVELPEGVWAAITGRSSTFRRGLLTPFSVIDQGYRGPLFVCVYNFTPRPVEVEAGERLAQMIPLPIIHGESVKVERLADSERGERGFGSSGR